MTIIYTVDCRFIRASSSNCAITCYTNVMLLLTPVVGRGEAELQLCQVLPETFRLEGQYLVQH